MPSSACVWRQARRRARGRARREQVLTANASRGGTLPKKPEVPVQLRQRVVRQREAGVERGRPLVAGHRLAPAPRACPARSGTAPRDRRCTPRGCRPPAAACGGRRRVRRAGGPRWPARSRPRAPARRSARGRTARSRRAQPSAVETSCAVTRTREPARRTLPSRMVATSSRAPASRTSSPMRPTANADVRAITRRPEIRVSASMISSASPSHR